MHAYSCMHSFGCAELVAPPKVFRSLPKVDPPKGDVTAVAVMSVPVHRVFAHAIDAARGDTPMHATHATAGKLLSSASMNYTPRHVAHGAVTGTSSITADGLREITITAADGWTGPDWDRVAAAMDAHNSYLHHDYRLLEDGREQWSLIYGDTA